MAVIVRMDSKEFLKKFVDNYKYKDYNFLIVSQDIKNKGKYNIAYSIQQLIPPAWIVQEFVNDDMKAYKTKYAKYLEMPKVEALISAIVKLTVINNSNVILLCSEREAEYKYLNMLCKYMEKIYGIKTFSFKEYNKNPDKCNSVPDEDRKKIKKILKYKIDSIKPEDVETKIDTKELKERLKKLSKKELKLLCKQRGIKVKSDDKSDIIKTIISKL